MKFIDTCLVCHRFLWKPSPLCHQCLEDFRAPDLIYRDIKELSVFSLLHYVFPLESFAKIWKSPHGASLCHILGLELAQKFASECFSPIIGVIPMPAKIKGAHDHAYLVAEVIARYFKVPVATQFLERLETHGEQKAKNLIQRNYTNVRLSDDFKFWDEQRSEGGNGVWLLVDDVLTSGATLFNAWSILGKPKALGLTLATTPLWANHGFYQEDFTHPAPKKSYLLHPH